MAKARDTGSIFQWNDGSGEGLIWMLSTDTYVSCSRNDVMFRNIKVGDSVSFVKTQDYFTKQVKATDVQRSYSHNRRMNNNAQVIRLQHQVAVTEIERRPNQSCSLSDRYILQTERDNATNALRKMEQNNQLKSKKEHESVMRESQNESTEESSTKMDDLRDERDKALNEVQRKQSKCFELMEQIQQLMKQKNELERKVYELAKLKLQEKVEKAEEESEIKKLSINPITNRSDVNLKDKLSQINETIHFKDYNDTFSNQRQVIDEWNVNTKKLQNIQSQIDKTKTIKVSDSDDMKTDTVCNELLKSYVACNELKAAQSKRLYTHDNVQQLFKKKNSICDHLETNEQKTTSYSNKNTAYQSQYQMTQTQRKGLISTIDVTVKKCNQTINKENALFEHIQQTQNMLNLLRRQKEQLSASANSCDALMNEYQTFETINTDAIQAIEGHFDSQWETFEQQWAKWKRVDIISWFKYQTIERNTSNVDWTNVNKQMKTRNIKRGASLEEFVTSTLDLIGIVDFNIASFLMKKITYLVTKYPKRSKTPYGDEGDEAPKEFYCAYTKEMMQDPVLAFDGNVYERGPIQKYLKEHGESPVTKKKASTMMLWPEKGLKLRIQEYQSND